MLRLSSNGKNAESGEIIDFNNNIQLRIQSAEPWSLYTLIVYDRSAPSAKDPFNSPYLHWLVVNIQGDDLSSGETVVEYQRPSPPPGSGVHRYVVALLTQLSDKPIQPEIPQGRIQFPIGEFTTGYGLYPSDTITFSVRSPSPRSPPPRSGGYWPTPNRNSDRGFRDRKSGSDDSRKYESEKRKDWTNPQMTDQEQRYCRCLVEVAAKQPLSCNKDRAWFEEREGRRCANPYAVCQKTVLKGQSRPRCNFILERMSDSQLRGLASLERLEVTPETSREEVISILRSKQ